MQKNKELIGKVFGRLKIIELIEKDKNYQFIFKCLCRCGNYKNIIRESLTSGRARSCGCYRIEVGKKFRTHGKINSREYYTWTNIKTRCTNKENDNYKYYGARGIKVCKRWINSFENFYKDMGDKPKGLTIERINNNKGYSKSNCKWATYTEQNNNKRNNK